MLYNVFVAYLLYKRVVCMMYLRCCMKFVYLNFSFLIFKLKSKQVSLGVSIFQIFASCINLLNKRSICVLYILCCTFSKEQNHLITGEKEFEEQLLGLGLVLVVWLRLFCVLYFSLLYFLHCIFPYCVYSPNNDITLTIQNIDVTQETTEKLRAEKQ